MGENSKIQWTDMSWSPWIGCTKISAGCTNCYADELMTRKPRWANTWGPRGKRERTSESYWRKPLRWNARAAAENTRYRVFPSLCDPFDEHESIKYEWRLDFHELIEATPHLDWLLLTKRPEKVMGLWPSRWHLLPNVWIGTSVENQETANKRIPDLLQIPAHVRFLSCEPLLGPIELDLVPARFNDPEIHWIIVGGESGSNARPMDLEWARDIVTQCKGAGVPVFVKQLGAWPYTSEAANAEEIYDEYDDPRHRYRMYPDDKKGGNIDEWPRDLRVREFPQAEVPA